MPPCVTLCFPVCRRSELKVLVSFCRLRSALALCLRYAGSTSVAVTVTLRLRPSTVSLRTPGLLWSKEFSSNRSPRVIALSRDASAGWVTSCITSSRTVGQRLP